jgi:hypothetical protein
LTRITVAVLVAIPSLWFSYLWLGSGEAWLHPEQMRAAAYIWNGSPETTAQRLRKSLDWAALDASNPTQWKILKPAHRVRPIADVAEVVDALARPVVSKAYPHPSLTPSGVIAAILAPLLLFAFTRLVTGNIVLAAAMTGLWISSTAFLSIIIPDIHSAAKRLAVLFLILSLYLAERHRLSASKATFLVMWASLFLSLFTDEMALGGFVAVAMIYTFDLAKTPWKALVLWSMPIWYLIIVKWGLPALYAATSVDGTPVFNAFGDTKKLALLTNLLTLDFYRLAVSQTTRAILALFGVIHHTSLLDQGAFLIAILLAAWSVKAGRGGYAAIAALSALFANGAYLTLLDLYPPGGRYYLASYGYYYHSGLALLALVALALMARAVKLSLSQSLAVAVVALPIMSVNFLNFRTLNQVIAIAQLYPYQPSTLYRFVAQGATAARVTFTADCELGLARFAEQIKVLRPEHGEFQNALRMFWISKDDIGWLLQAHYPSRNIGIDMDEDNCVEARDKAFPAGAPN